MFGILILLILETKISRNYRCLSKGPMIANLINTVSLLTYQQLINFVKISTFLIISIDGLPRLIVIKK